MVSGDFKTTALILTLNSDKKYEEYLHKRDELKAKADTKKLAKFNEEFNRYKELKREKEHKNIANIRAIIKKYNKDAKMFLGGVSMIANDIIDYIKSDIKIFGNILVLLLIATLFFIFKKVEFVIIPVVVSLVSLIITTGFFGIFGWNVTVISSNFVSLQLIITISIILHLIVRY